MIIRLNKFLSDSGVCSRRQADLLIEKGQVFVNGKKASLGMKINPEIDKVSVSGKVVQEKAPKVYYAVYKPRGVVSTVSDEKNRKSVIDLVPKEPRVYPVGRLDKESEGLIILTNDGELTNELTHPSKEHEKEYLVFVKTQNSNINIKEFEAKFTKGLRIDGKLMKADKAEMTVHKSNMRNTMYDIRFVLHTGYNRQIRKMCDKIGLQITKLIRVRIGKLTLESLELKPGEYKEVKPEDINIVY